jgi:hypothetical protein
LTFATSVTERAARISSREISKVSTPLARSATHPRKCLSQRGDLSLRIDLLSQRKATLIAAHGVLEALLSLVQRAEQSKTLDLTPTIARRSEMAERRACKITRSLVFASLRQRFGEIERRERNEIAVLDLSRECQCILERLFRKLDVASIESDATVVVERNRLASSIA